MIVVSRRASCAGSQDIVLPGLRKIIQVHGCFWHMHFCQRRRKPPVNNAAYWEAKRLGNARRDRRNVRKLVRQGWKVLVVWECQTRDAGKLVGRLKAFLAGSRLPHKKS